MAERKGESGKGEGRGQSDGASGKGAREPRHAGAKQAGANQGAQGLGAAGHAGSAAVLKLAAAATSVVALGVMAAIAVGLLPNPLAGPAGQAVAQAATPEQASSQGATAEPAGSAAGATVSGGTLDASATWQGEVTVTGDVVIPAGVTLTIEPGTNVELAAFSDDNPFEPAQDRSWDNSKAIAIVTRGGVLIANGTAEQPITFAPSGTDRTAADAMANAGNEALAGAWDGLQVGSDSQLSYVSLYFPANGVYVNNAEYNPAQSAMELAGVKVVSPVFSGVRVNNANVNVSHADIRGAGRGVVTEGRGSTQVRHTRIDTAGVGVVAGAQHAVSVTNNIFTNVNTGVESESGESLVVAQNTFVMEEEPPDVWNLNGSPAVINEGAAQAVDLAGDTFQIFNNIVVGPFRHFCTFSTFFTGVADVGYNLVSGTTGPDFAGNSGAYGTTPLADGSSGVIHAPPHFGNQDYLLMTESPAIDAGAPGTLDADGSPADLGAYGGPLGADW
jgi:hypothetical protein